MYEKKVDVVQKLRISWEVAEIPGIRLRKAPTNMIFTSQKQRKMKRPPKYAYASNSSGVGYLVLEIQAYADVPATRVGRN